MAERLGELLVKAGQITKEQLREALAKQKEEGGRLGSNLVKMGLVQEPELVEFLSKHFKVSAINLSRVEIDEAVVKIIPADVARKYTIMPVSKAGAKVTIAMLDPTNVFAMDDIKFMTGYNVEPVIASETAIRAAIEKYYGSTHALELKKVMEDLDDDATDDLEVLEEEPEEFDIDALADESDEAPVVRLVNIILTDAIKRGASDIHIEPYEKKYRCRYRVDGLLYEVMYPPLRLREAITSRLRGGPSPKLAILRRTSRNHSAIRRSLPGSRSTTSTARRSCRRSPTSVCPRTAGSRSRPRSATRTRSSTTASRCCRRSSARRSSCVCWTKTT